MEMPKATVATSGGAANSARILLLSANDKHPNGLANGSDQVGRNYMFHNSQAVVVLALEPNLTRFQKTISLNDFYFRDKDFDFPMGNIQMIGKSKGPMFRDDAPFFAPGFALDEMAGHAVDFWLSFSVIHSTIRCPRSGFMNASNRCWNS
jgi:choline dehydrogenase-like flavoprotein